MTGSWQVPAPPDPRLHLAALTEKGAALWPVFHPGVNKTEKPNHPRAAAFKSRQVCERCPRPAPPPPSTDLPRAALPNLGQASFNFSNKTPRPTQRAHPLPQPTYIPAHSCQDGHEKVGTERERKKERERVTHRWRRHRGFQSHFELRMTEAQTLPQSPSPRPPGPRRRPATAPGPHWAAARGEGRGTASGGWRRRTNRAGGDLRATDTHTHREGRGEKTQKEIKWTKKPRQNTDRETIKVEPGHEGRPPPHPAAGPSGAALPEGRPTARIWPHYLLPLGLLLSLKTPILLIAIL